MAQVKPANKKKTTKGSLIATIVAIVLLVAFVVSLMSATGLFVRMKSGAETKNFNINGAMMDYFAQAALENWYNGEYVQEMQEMYGDYAQLFIQYGLGPFNPQKSYKEQIYDEKTGMTYADLFVEKANDYVARLLNLCEAAKADSSVNFAELEAEAEEHAKESLKSIEQNAKSNNMDFTTYIRQYLGRNLSKGDLEKCLIIENIASHYAEAKYDQVFDNMTDGEKVEFFKENIGSFFTAGYLGYTLSNPKTVTYPVAEDYEGGEESKAYKAAKEAAEKTNADAETEEDKVELPKPEDYVGGKENAIYKDLLAKAEEAKAANEAQKAIDKAIIDSLGTAKTADEFKSIVLEANYEKAFKTAYDALKLTDENKPSDEELAQYKADLLNKVIAAAIAGEENIESNAVVGDDSSEWEKGQATIPAKIISSFASTLESLEQTANFSTSSNLGQKLFGGVKAEYGVDYESYETPGTNAVVGDVWTENAMLSNKDSIVNAIEIYKARLDDEDYDKEEMQSAIDTLEDSLEDIEEDIANADKTGHYTYAAFYVTEAAHREDAKVRDVGHILFQVNENGTYKTALEAEKAANDLLAKIEEKAVGGVVSKEIFEEFATGKTADSSIFYEDVYTGQMVEEFENWLFSAKKVGELGLVETDYGWHIMYYGGEGEEAVWQYLAHLAATNEEYADWEEGLDHSVNIDNSLFAEFYNR